MGNHHQRTETVSKPSLKLASSFSESGKLKVTPHNGTNTTKLLLRKPSSSSSMTSSFAKKPKAKTLAVKLTANKPQSNNDDDAFEDIEATQNAIKKAKEDEINQLKQD